jgi:hypothetical protein
MWLFPHAHFELYKNGDLTNVQVININNPTYVQDKYCKMEIVESIIFGQFGYPIFEGIFTLHN